MSNSKFMGMTVGLNRLVGDSVLMVRVEFRRARCGGVELRLIGGNTLGRVKGVPTIVKSQEWFDDLPFDCVERAMVCFLAVGV